MNQGKLEDVLPLAPGQAGLLYHALLDAEGVDVYIVQLRFRIEEPVRVEALHAALDALLVRHAGLRVCFRHKGLDQPVQLVPRQAKPGWREVDLSARSPAADTDTDTDTELEHLLDADRARRFDVGRPPLVRATLVRLPTGFSELILTVHHLVLDGWSAPILARDLADLYAGIVPPPAPHYRGYPTWLKAQPTEEAQAAWRAALAGLAEPTRLVPEADLRIGVLPTQLDFQLPADLSEAVRRRARDAGVTVNTLVQAAWGLVLGRMTGSDDVTFGAVSSGRPGELEGAESMVGMYVTTLPVRVRIRAGQTVDELLRTIQREQTDLAEHHHLPLAQIQRDTVGRDLFDTVVAFENYPRAGLTDSRPGAPQLFDVRNATHYPVTVAIVSEECLWLQLAYRPDCVTASTADLLVACLVRAFGLLAVGSGVVAADPAASDTGSTAIAAELDVLPPAEGERVRRFGTGARSAPHNSSVPECFARQVERTPHAVAIESCATGRSMTYAELDRAADLLADRLEAAGVGRESAVAVLLSRSADLVVAELGVLKAGGCYVPLDPAEPEARLSGLLRAAGAEFVLTDHSPAWLPERIRTLRIGSIDAPAQAPARPDRRPAPHPDSAAYAMYTSGSTGVPKGVLVTHHSILNLAADHRFATGAHDRVLLHSPHTFDATNFEMWVPLLTGGTVVLAGPEPLEPPVLRDLVAGCGITAVWLTAELLRTVADLAPEAVAGVREVWAGGDVLSAEAVGAIQAACPGVVVVNGYGPTETTTFATCHRLEKSSFDADADADPNAAPDSGAADNAALPIGAPLDGTTIRLLDRRLRPAPAGTTGEVYIGGAGLARGYLGRPADTAERFVADPFGPPGSRLFRTGDLGRWAPDGALEFLGRADGQLKIRGRRVEPAEVEALLEGCPAVARALVHAEADPSGAKRLAADLVLRTGGDLGQVRRYAGLHLPAHLRPDLYHQIDTVPLTAHGKVDRAAVPGRRLPETTVAAADQGFRSASERILCELFAQALGLAGFEPEQNFFDAGGHSLLAMRLVAAIEAESGRRLPVGILMDSPSPAALARRLKSPTDSLGLAHVLKLRAGGDRTPLFFLHSGSGLTWRYATILPYLEPGRPLYGIQSTAISRTAPMPEDLGELAEQYLDRIRAIQPEGPYLLLGWSFGGLLAYDLAARLTRAGQQVALLAVVDSIPGDTPDLVPDGDLVEQAALKIVSAYATTPPAAVAEGARLVRASVFAAVQEGGWCADWSTERLETMIEHCSGSIRLTNRYRPPRFDGTMTLFCATHDAGAPTPAAKASIWRRSAAKVLVTELDCGHSEAMHPGPAQAIAAVINPIIGDH